MLCNRNKNDFEDIVKAMGSSKKQPKEFLIEEKLDGERIQLHKRGEEYRYFSRKDKNYTYLYGVDRTSQDGALTPHVWQCFDPRVEEWVATTTYESARCGRLTPRMRCAGSSWTARCWPKTPAPVCTSSSARSKRQPLVSLPAELVVPHASC